MLVARGKRVPTEPCEVTVDLRSLDPSFERVRIQGVFWSPGLWVAATGSALLMIDALLLMEKQGYLFWLAAGIILAGLGLVIASRSGIPAIQFRTKQGEIALVLLEAGP